MFTYEEEWFKLKKYMMSRERLSKTETMTKMAELEVARVFNNSKLPGMIEETLLKDTE